MSAVGTVAGKPNQDAQARDRRPASRHCPRCGGNIFFTPDEDGGAEWACLQCGRSYPGDVARTPAEPGRQAA